MIHLVPKNGAMVRDPISKKVIDENGIKLAEITTFYFRRLQEGSMVNASAAKPAQESKAKGEK